MSQVAVTQPQFLSSFKMAAVLEKVRFARRMQAVFSETGLAINALQCFRTTGNATRHIRKRVCRTIV